MKTVFVKTVFEVKQKLLEKLKEIARKRAFFKKKRKFRRASSRLFSFPKDKYEALEEVREMLGFSKEELSILFALLEKSVDGHLHFDVGDMTIEFHTFEFDESSPNEISLIVEASEKETTYRVEYDFGYSGRKFSGSNWIKD